MSRNGTTVITKRDGAVEPFSAAKLQRCVAAVLASAGYDGHLARALAKAVAIHIEGWTDPAPPTSQYVHDCVRAVLTQTGLGEAAERLRLRSEQRLRQRARVRVFEITAPSAAPRPWTKGRIVTDVQARYGLGHAVARFIAGEVETRALALNCERVSTELVDALVRNELAAWGLLEDRPPAPTREAAGGPAGAPGDDGSRKLAPAPERPTSPAPRPEGRQARSSS